MVDEGIAERLQPSLLDRLTDQAPDRRTEERRDRVIDIRRLTEIVKRDLTWLLNSQSFESQMDPEMYPNVTNSVINYGVREVAGEMSTSERAEVLRKMIIEAIKRFEPRIRAGTLRVDFAERQIEQTSVIAFDIRAEMWAQPLPLELYLRSQVNLTTGELKLESRA